MGAPDCSGIPAYTLGEAKEPAGDAKDAGKETGAEVGKGDGMDEVERKKEGEEVEAVAAEEEEDVAVPRKGEVDEDVTDVVAEDEMGGRERNSSREDTGGMAVGEVSGRLTKPSRRRGGVRWPGGGGSARSLSSSESAKA